METTRRGGRAELGCGEHRNDFLSLGILLTVEAKLSRVFRETSREELHSNVYVGGRSACELGDCHFH